MKRVLVLFLMLVSFFCYGQLDSLLSADERRNPYIDINNAGTSMYEFVGNVISLQFYDAYGVREELPIVVSSSGSGVRKTLRLFKEHGVNHFGIDLSKHFSFHVNDIFSFAMEDDKGEVYRWYARSVEAPKTNLNAEILVNVKSVQCGQELGNLVEFYGEIAGGSPPYEVNWYVVDEARTQFLYQPRTVSVPGSDVTPVLIVDKKPVYMVLMTVIDRCGTFARKMIIMRCEDPGKNASTIFIEPRDLTTPPTKISN